AEPQRHITYCTVLCSHHSCHIIRRPLPVLFFFFNDPAPTAIYTLSLHDALPIYIAIAHFPKDTKSLSDIASRRRTYRYPAAFARSEEHTSELQSLRHLVCRLLLEKKNNKKQSPTTSPKKHTNTSIYLITLIVCSP